jgi:hypothetical protein
MAAPWWRHRRTSMMAVVLGKRSAHRGRSLLPGLVIVVVLTAAVWRFALGSFSPCEAMRLQVRRIGSERAGFLGLVVVNALADLRGSDFSPFECAVAAVKLRVRGEEALEDIVVHGRHER